MAVPCSSLSLETVLRKAGYTELCKLIHYTSHVEDELVWNAMLITDEISELIKTKPTQGQKSRCLLDHVCNNFDLDYLKKFADILESDKTNKQNVSAGRLLHKAIEEQ
jgi:hypothetical protein